MVRDKRIALMFVMILLFFRTLFSYGCGEKKEKVFRVGILSGLDYVADTAEGIKVSEGLLRRADKIIH